MMEILHCTVNGRPVEVGYDLRESLLDTCGTGWALPASSGAAR